MLDRKESLIQKLENHFGHRAEIGKNGWIRLGGTRYNPTIDILEEKCRRIGIDITDLDLSSNCSKGEDKDASTPQRILKHMRSATITSFRGACQTQDTQEEKDSR